jgi:hypothetical protein
VVGGEGVGLAGIERAVDGLVVGAVGSIVVGHGAPRG